MEAYLALGGESELQQLFILLTLPWEPSEQPDNLHVFLSDQAASGDEVSAGIFLACLSISVSVHCEPTRPRPSSCVSFDSHPFKLAACFHARGVKTPAQTDRCSHISELRVQRRSVSPSQPVPGQAPRGRPCHIISVPAG